MRILLLANGMLLSLMARMALPAGAQSTVCMSTHSINAATAIAERPAATTPVDTSKKPKELGFTMPGAPLIPCLLPTLLMLVMMHTYFSHENFKSVTQAWCGHKVVISFMPPVTCEQRTDCCGRS